MKSHALPAGFEPRWPVALALLTLITILALLPEALRLLPLWVTFAIGVVMLTPIVAVGVLVSRERWLRIERVVILIFVTVVIVLLLANLANLMHAVIYRSAKITGLQLLTSSVGLWVSNVIMFSLLYWQIDRGGPEARARAQSQFPDWLFPQESAPSLDVPKAWRPMFVDYLYLAYSSSTAFSATDTIPLTARAKLLTMLQSAISLLTIVLIASRAINILGN